MAAGEVVAGPALTPRLEIQQGGGKTDFGDSVHMNDAEIIRDDGSDVYMGNVDTISGAHSRSVVLRSGGGDVMSLETNGNVGIGTNAPDAVALLEISSTTKALLLSRMTTTQRDAMTAVNGMVLYNSTTNAVNAYENGAWVDL